MDVICDLKKCTGCGMCTNICPKGAITMAEGEHGFVFPKIDQALCVDCNLCKSRCPSNAEQATDTNVKTVYAAWNRDKVTRAKSTSGGLFTLFAKAIIDQGGVVCGVAWNDKNHPEHILAENAEELVKFQSSKYSQSNTGDIYRKVKKILDAGKPVLFSGTPCQNTALRSYLGKDYYNLFNIDLVCHGVPSNKTLDAYFNLFKKEIKQVRLRYKDPYWDYCFVRIDFTDGTKYQDLTINDAYFNLFNIGYTLRESCHNCQYASINRKGDITLADFWGYRAHSFATRNYNKGTSCVLINSEKGQQLFDMIKTSIYYEEATLEQAIRGNKCLKEPFRIEQDKLKQFWEDYESGLGIDELNEKYTANTFKLPEHLQLRRLKSKWRWIIGK